ncbi:polysaccharide lyase family 14 protein [Athelia psychrophila]|uniref:Polysaccharide lyase family 14 protein n=1 Tax=Athelia psychrophila TaxID=1759441 RepID=A0A166CMP4_9AGAM|nr:polysaccharide lyase family 14 protein [Fibularhizoctonia sp. CBS 109695]
MVQFCVDVKPKIRDTTDYHDRAVKKAVQSFEPYLKWKRALLEDRDLSQTFEAGIHSPLYAQSRFFVGSKIQTHLTKKFEENKTFAIDLLQPGHGLYDALQACRHDVVPQELCATLIADVILVLEFQATPCVDSKIVEKQWSASHFPSFFPSLETLHSAMPRHTVRKPLSWLVLAFLGLNTLAAPALNGNATDTGSPVPSAPAPFGSSNNSFTTPVAAILSAVVSSFPTPASSIAVTLSSVSTITTAAATAMTTDAITITDFITEAQMTITVLAPVSTVIDTITITLAPTPTAATPAQASSSVWAAPPQMTDLAAFNISAFPGGQRNLQVVNGIPANASASTTALTAQYTGSADLLATALTAWDNSTSALRLLYPAHSIDPAKKPQGGAEFYATPIGLQNANNVSFEYSVFFPLDYDWVLGGKLPGLYGGHTGCSGGNSATTCFSTRLMWRPNGMGELYLYAPKAKQTKALCADPRSVCDAAYGFSIGRGSFRYTAGGWTHLRQIVTLNTPGKQDGVFILDVNGTRIIDRSDVFYRDVPPPPASKSKNPVPTGLLGPLLGGLSQVLHPQDILNLKREGDSQSPDPSPTALLPLEHDPLASHQARQVPAQVPIVTTTAIAAVSPVITTAAAPVATAVLFALQEDEVEAATIPQPIGFSGIFFSTFFGGHESQYATPRDQYAWFRGFAMSSSYRP